MSLEHRLTASTWHDDDWSPLYAYAGTGSVVAGLDHEIGQCLEAVEKGWLTDDLDPVVEHQRLTSLLIHVRPELAADRALRLGRAEGYAAGTDWKEDVLEGPWTDHLEATARRLHHGLKNDESQVLETLPTNLITAHAVSRVEITVGWVEPSGDDQIAHEQWEAIRRTIWQAYQRGFRAAVIETATAACQHLVYGVPTPPPGISPRDLASARFLGADTSLTKAAGLFLIASDAEAVLAGKRVVEAPTVSLPGADNQGFALANSLADEYVIATARATTLGAIERALRHEWHKGRDTIWEPALRAAALRVLGQQHEAQEIEVLNNGRWLVLGEAAGPFPSRSKPYLRPSQPAGAGSPHQGRRSAPERWVVEPVGDWHGTPHEVAFNPSAFEITIVNSSSQGPMTPAGWERQAVDGPRTLWTRDRTVVARLALDRFDQRVVGVAADMKGANNVPPGPSLGLDP